MVITGQQVVDGADVSQVGGKARGLGLLLKAGCDVPPFFVVSPDDLLDPNELTAALTEIGGPVAVRSSAVFEDGSVHSFAGQLDSVLGVDGIYAVIAAIEACRESGRSDRVAAYCEAKGVHAGPVAVVVQKMVFGDRSGVMFTREPEHPALTLISAAWGLGEGVVKGTVEADSYRVGPAGDVTSEIEDKTCAIRIVQGELKEVPITQRGHEPVLSDRDVVHLAALGRKLEATLGAPQDVEFTYDGEQLYLVQTRPITTPMAHGQRMLWDNSNIVESYSGVTTPLTYSFARNAYTIVYELFCGVMGVDRATLAANRTTFRRMIGLIRGRVYYNMNAWYRVITLLPGYRWNREFMEQMMGVSEAANDEDALAHEVAPSKLKLAPRMTWLGLSLAWRLLDWKGASRRFTSLFGETMRAARSRDLSTLSPHELVELYAELDQKLLWNWTAPIVNDFFTMVFHGVLRSLCGKWLDDGELTNALLSGDGQLESMAPTRELLTAAARLRDDPLLPEFLSDKTDLDVLNIALQDHRFRSWLDRWMSDWGDRCVDELKLETVPLRERPEVVVGTLRQYLAGDPVDVSTFGSSELKRRKDAELTALRGLNGGLRELVFKWVLGRTRFGVNNRETLRFLRTRIFGLARDIFRQMGRRMAEADALESPDDVVWLHVEEVLGWVDGTTITTDLKRLTALRREEFEAFEAEPAPAERFWTLGPVHRRNRFSSAMKTAVDGDLTGTPCFPGVVEGEVAVRHHPGDGSGVRGRILVASRTDPGWVPLFPSVIGLIVERGSLLSHSAVVAREMGIPTIVGARGATDRLADGVRIRLDAGAGTVEILPEKDTEEVAS